MSEQKNEQKRSVFVRLFAHSLGRQRTGERTNSTLWGVRLFAVRGKVSA
jgi:hypothetical protein